MECRVGVFAKREEVLVLSDHRSASQRRMETSAMPNRYISAHGIRGFAGGYSEDGLEFWSFPLQLVSGYYLSFVLPKALRIYVHETDIAQAVSFRQHFASQK